ncbi:MAG: histone H1 [Candidatus Omnitrophica bacterium]|nr:histone H1 [Candidatus Omnitrophota bacterium]
MEKWSDKKQDESEFAYDIIKKKTKDGKNAAAVALGHLGGLKGGIARAKKLSKKKRIEIAMKAAQVRWNKYE